MGKNTFLSKSGERKKGGNKQGHVSAVILSDATKLFSLTLLRIFLTLIYVVVPGSGWGRSPEEIQIAHISKKLNSSYVNVRMLEVGKAILGNLFFCKANFWRLRLALQLL